MYLPEPAQTNNTLELLESASDSPSEICADNPELQAAFDQGLRELAEDIIRFHPNLAHILIHMNEDPSPYVAGQN
ncbi:MAG: hypothetical protein L7V87_08145 [Verrucomicrobiales bacterium]|jgi:hypothetical protein|nr:hypothetical protein [Verrucomicrobiales bacterium]